MPERELAILVFAPATVALVVTALRRVSASLYWTVVMGLACSIAVSLGWMRFGAQAIVSDPLTFGLVFVMIPTVAVFSVGRLILIHRGGAYLFAASCTVYFLGLTLAVLAGLLLRVVVLP